MSLTQFIQGFVKNILDEKDLDCREKMLMYLGDLMEDTTDFSWSNAKASHAALLCEMERGVVTWQDTGHIDRIRRAHAQKHPVHSTQNWARNSDPGRRPWFCKAFQSGACTFNKDHKVAGRLHKHLCALCLNQGRYLSHPEKEDYLFSKKNQAKNG